MVVSSWTDAEADQIFHALADTTRRDILDQVLVAEQSVSALSRRYPISFAAVQKHVAVLQRAGVVEKRRHGREQLVRGNPEPIRRAARQLQQYERLWRRRAQRIDDLLDKAKGTD